MSAYQTRAAVWHTDRFPNASAPVVLAKAIEELGEVASALIVEEGTNSATGHAGDVAAEAADVVIALLVLIGRWWPHRDVLADVGSKLVVLETRGAHRASLQ